MATVASIARRLQRRLLYLIYPPFARKRVFSYIFEHRLWGDNESISGIGSRLAYTENIRRELPILLNRFSIETVFDAPCGDFYWMRDIVASTGICYLGGDIVPEVVDRAMQNAAGLNLKAAFRVHDLAQDPMPEADLWICRDCLFHLSYREIWSVLKRFAESNIKYVLVTTHTDGSKNRNIVTGNFRHLDVFAEPFFLPRDVLAEFDDYAPPLAPRKMIMLSREQVAYSLEQRKLDHRRSA